MVEDGDTITIDVPVGCLDVDAPIDDRLADWEPVPPSHERLVLQKYGAMFGSAADGAVTEPPLE